NLAVALKYVLFRSDARETLLSLGLDWDVGETGRKRVGAESFDTVTPALFFGRGLCDLPDSLELLKPLAVTGTFGVAIPTRDRTGQNVGVLGQLHFYLDDIAPQVFTRTPFHGVLGPAVPR